MITTLRFNVPVMMIACLDCKREAAVPARSGPTDIIVPCICETKPIPNFALVLRYPGQKDPFAIHPLQEGRPGMRV